MIEINKEQAAFIRTFNDNATIDNPVTRTMRQKSKRHNYYACEDESIMKLLDIFNSKINVVETYGTVN